jgi:hypothetical protein
VSDEIEAAGYGELLATLKAEVRAAQRRAHRVVNTELLNLCWTIGCRRTADGPGCALGYRPTGNGPEWIWADSEVCHSPDQFDPELLLPYGAQLRACRAGRGQLSAAGCGYRVL